MNFRLHYIILSFQISRNFFKFINTDNSLLYTVNPAYSELPAFLVKDGGLNSGFMLAHCTAAALVSENKTLCHPASVDSLSTSAGTEDHVSMGGFAARKCLQVVRNVEKVIAIELLAACQAIEFLRPLKTTTLALSALCGLWSPRTAMKSQQ